MTEEAQRIAIAESVGIHLHDGDHAPSDYVFISGLPDYLNDLNAMHEVEKMLTDKQMSLYREWLPLHDWYLIKATAAQRAEAYLRTIGKWEGEADE